MDAHDRIERMGITEWGYLFLLSLLWGGSFFFIEICLQSMPPMTITAMRLILAALFLQLYRLFRGLPFPKEPAVLIRFLMMGLINNAIPFSLLIWGQKFVTGGTAAMLVAATPFFSIIVSHIFTTDEKITVGKLIGVIIGLAGVALIVGVTYEDNSLIGKIAILGTAFTYAVGAVYARGMRRFRINPLTAATGQLSGAALIMIPVMLLVDRPWLQPMPSSASIIALVVMSLLTTAFAYVIYFRILSSSGATNVLLVTFLNPVSASLLGVLFLQESFTLIQLLGILTIGVGLICIDGRLFKRKSS